MFVWVLNTPLFTTTFSLEKKSEWKEKQSSDILNFQTAEKMELHWITPTEAATRGKERCSQKFLKIHGKSPEA